MTIFPLPSFQGGFLNVAALGSHYRHVSRASCPSAAALDHAGELAMDAAAVGCRDSGTVISSRSVTGGVIRLLAPCLFASATLVRNIRECCSHRKKTERSLNYAGRPTSVAPESRWNRWAVIATGI